MSPPCRRAAKCCEIHNTVEAKLDGEQERDQHLAGAAQPPEEAFIKSMSILHSSSTLLASKSEQKPLDSSDMTAEEAAETDSPKSGCGLLEAGGVQASEKVEGSQMEWTGQNLEDGKVSSQLPFLPLPTPKELLYLASLKA